MTNIRGIIKESGFPLWRIADRVGVCENTVSRWLRHEPDGERRDRLLRALSELRAEAESHEGDKKRKC